MARKKIPMSITVEPKHKEFFDKRSLNASKWIRQKIDDTEETDNK